VVKSWVMEQMSREAKSAGAGGSVQTDDDECERNESVKGGWRNDDAGAVYGRHAAEAIYVISLCLCRRRRRRSVGCSRGYMT
jgi:hypothetical protein